MKLIGVLGGISPHSTAYYYRVLNAYTREVVGGRDSARCLIHSVNFGSIERLHEARDWPGVTRELCAAARSLEEGGAECVLLACNTLHRVADEIESVLTVPFLHIGDTTAERLQDRGARRVGLLGTRFTMESNFIRERIEARGIDVVTPDREQRSLVHRIIYDELCDGIMTDAAREAFRGVIADLSSREALDGIVMACTEIGLLLTDTPLPVVAHDTTRIHAEAAVRWALEPRGA